MPEKKALPFPAKTGEYKESVKNISAEMWINENSVPTVVAYGSWDRVQPFRASLRSRIFSGKRNAYLADIDRQAQKHFERIRNPVSKKLNAYY